MGEDDRELVLRCRDGNEEAFRVLLSRYEGYIYSLCYRLTNQRDDAMELAQEAMFKVVVGLDSYRIYSPFKPWLRRVVINACLSFLRRRGPDMLSLDNMLEKDLAHANVLTAKNADPSGAAEWMEIQDAVRRAAQELPPPVRMVIILRHQEEMSYQDIAGATGLPVNTVKTYLFRGRRMLKDFLSRTYGWEGS